MKYYLVNEPIKIKDGKGNFLDISPKSLAVAGDIRACEYGKDGTRNDLSISIPYVYTTYEDAVGVANFKAKQLNRKDYAYPVFVVKSKFSGEKSEMVIGDQKIPAVKNLPEPDLLSGSLEHVNKKYKKVDLSAIELSGKEIAKIYAKQEADRKKDKLEVKKVKKSSEEVKKTSKQPYSFWTKLGFVTVGGLALGTGLFFSGYLPALIAYFGPGILPATTTASQVLICGGLGFGAVATLTGIWEIGKLAYQWFAYSSKDKANEEKTKEDETNQSGKTDEKKYQQAMKKSTKHIKELESKAIECKTILKTFDTLINEAKDAKFDAEGALAAEGQPIRNKLQVVCWKEKRMQQLVDTADKKERGDLKKEITEKAKHKLEKASNKPLFR